MLVWVKQKKRAGDCSPALIVTPIYQLFEMASSISVILFISGGNLIGVVSCLNKSQFGHQYQLSSSLFPVMPMKFLISSPGTLCNSTISIGWWQSEHMIGLFFAILFTSFLSRPTTELACNKQKSAGFPGWARRNTESEARALRRKSLPWEGGW